MLASKFQHRVARTRLGGCKLLEFSGLCSPLWIRRVLVDPTRSPSARAQEGQLEGPMLLCSVEASVFFPACSRFAVVSRLRLQPDCGASRVRPSPRPRLLRGVRPTFFPASP